MDQKMFWNNKFADETYLYGKSPNRFVAEKAHLFKPNAHLLCLGEGEGRNATFLAGQGHKVTALDASDIGLEKAVSLAREKGLTIETIHADLSHWSFPPLCYDGVVSSYLHLPNPLRLSVFHGIAETLTDYGFFIGEFFSHDQLAFESGGPRNADLLYGLEEFEKLFAAKGLKTWKLSKEIVHLDEGIGHKGDASVIRIVVQKYPVK